MNYSVVPHFHYDLAWVMLEEQYLEVTLNILEQINTMMSKYPEYTHVLDQGYYLNKAKQRKPNLFKDLKQWVDEGRIELVQGGWVMPDLNLISESTLYRNYEKNKDFFDKNFGVKPNVFWAIDCFGHNGMMPKLAREVGCDYYVLWRGVPKYVPSDFIWSGSDGTQIKALNLKYGYSLYGPMQRDLEKAKQLSDGFIPFGCDFAVPDEELINKVLNDEKTTFSLPKHYFQTKNKDLPIIHMEFLDTSNPYAPPLIDCWSTRTRLKQAFRLAEREKHNIDNLIYCSFHDLICGTAIDRAYDPVWKRLSQTLKLYKPKRNENPDKDLEERVSVWIQPDCGDTYWFRQYKDVPFSGWQINPKIISYGGVGRMCRSELFVELETQPQMRAVLKIDTGQSNQTLTDKVLGGWVKRGLGRWWCGNGVFKYGDWTVHEYGTPQHQVTEDGQIQIVLYRSVSLLSWGDAGPQLHVSEALELGKNIYRFTIKRGSVRSATEISRAV